MAESARAVPGEAAWAGYIRRCAARDESALAALYDESSPFAFAVALRILQDEADAAEVVVDVYRQIWEGAARFDEQRGSAAAWIIILARSRAMDRRRFRTVRTRTTVKVEEIRELRSTSPSPESLAIDGQRSTLVSRALSSVPAEQREALTLAFFGGLSHPEVAERLGEPLGTVKTRIRLAIAKLREQLKDSV